MAHDAAAALARARAIPAPSPFVGAAANGAWRWMPRPLGPQMPWEAGPNPLSPPRVDAEVWALALGLGEQPPAAALLPLAEQAPENLEVLGAAHAVDARTRAERKWIAVARAFGQGCALGKQLDDVDSDPTANDDSVRQLLAHTFAGKATSTLLRRVGAMNRFVSWLRVAGATRAPLEEPRVYAYVASLTGGKAAATAAQSFVQALRFSRTLLGLPVPEGVFSARVNGAATLAMAGGRRRPKPPPLTVDMVRALERVVCDTSPLVPLHVKYDAGFLLFAVHARARSRGSPGHRPAYPRLRPQQGRRGAPRVPGGAAVRRKERNGQARQARAAARGARRRCVDGGLGHPMGRSVGTGPREHQGRHG